MSRTGYGSLFDEHTIERARLHARSDAEASAVLDAAKHAAAPLIAKSDLPPASTGGEHFSPLRHGTGGSGLSAKLYLNTITFWCHFYEGTLTMSKNHLRERLSYKLQNGITNG